ncbi:MAG: histidine kinase [Acidimicrobiales bacterium]|nr:histidine kinase [Acidimicrobiales bacterium]
MQQWWQRARLVAQRRPEILDAMLTVALAGAAAASVAAGPGDADRDPDGVTVALIALGLVPYLFRRRAPLLVLAVAVVPVLALLLRGDSTAGVGVGIFVLVYTVAAWAPRWQSAVALLVIGGLLTIVVVRVPDRMPLPVLITNVVLLAGAALTGDWARQRRSQLAWATERASLLEREQHLVADIATAQERLRIARDLHDVIAHSLSVIAVQASVAGVVLDDQPDQARLSLDAIAAMSRESLDEVRAMVSALRAGEAEPYAPTRQLADVAHLCDEVREVGLPVELSVQGAAAQVPTGVAVAAYRIIQQSLTNVVQHAPGAPTRVTVEVDPREVRVAVVNGAVHQPGAKGDDRNGQGLIGMRERVALWGGTLTAGPQRDGGFAVSATLPMEVAP